MEHDLDPAVDDIIALFGSRSEACKVLGVSSQAISNWRREGVPDTRRLQAIRIATEQGMEIPASLYEARVPASERAEQKPSPALV